MLFSYGLEVWTVAAVAAYKDLQRRTLNDEGSPQRLITLQQTAREMTCRCAMENKTISTTRDMDYELKQDYLEKSNYYYSKKDRATLTALRMLDYKDVEAYFVKVKSKFLKGKLFEIVIEEEDVILHSTSSLILKCLREEGVFHEESRKSLIDDYVNHRY